MSFNDQDTLQASLGIQGDGEPVETAQPAETQAETAGSHDESGESHNEGEKQEGEQAPRKHGIQKRIQKLSAKLAEKDAIIDRLMQGQKPTAEPQAPAPVLGKPVPPDEDDFEDRRSFRAAQAKYQEDLTDWKVEQRLSADKRQAEERENQKRLQENQAQWAKRLDAAHQAHPDLQDLLEDEDLPTTPAMTHFLMESDLGAELLYALAKNPVECQRIAGLEPRKAELALARLEARLETPSTPPQKRASAAPAPIAPVKGSASAIRDASKLSDADWLRAQRKR